PPQSTSSSLSRSSTPPPSPPKGFAIVVALIVMLLSLILRIDWMGIAAAATVLILSLRLLWVVSAPVIKDIISPRQQSFAVALVGVVGAVAGFLLVTGLLDEFWRWLGALNWDAVGALGEVFGAIGQILIAILAVYIAWRQYIISKDLTIQQNTITQQQTIDSYFQGISELVLDAEGLLEDWPQERAIAEGRTAAILGSVDAGGKAKIIRFLSRSRLLTPLKRDRHLGRAMLDGMGGYQEDRDYGIRVIDLGVMLAATNLAKTDLRWTDLSDANFVRSDLSGCDLVKANLARAILYETNVKNADLMGTRLFYGPVKTASPRTRVDIPNYETGEFTGVVIENADLTGVQRLSKEQREYCCAWGGSKTRQTIPGGCDGIPNKLGR
ncbi:MAG: pentapeptide repeat-containing protein, partial [Leptolyngbyaceae bacterium]|nr:pentapeptide repeat-containing protein [Leptolyngbyaceae bacterium]